MIQLCLCTMYTLLRGSVGLSTSFSSVIRGKSTTFLHGLQWNNPLKQLRQSEEASEELWKSTIAKAAITPRESTLKLREDLTQRLSQLHNLYPAAQLHNLVPDDHVNVAKLSSETGYAEVIAQKEDPTGRYLAYAVDTDGSESFTLHLRDKQTKKDPLVAFDVISIAWANGGYLYYTQRDEHGSPTILCRTHVKHAAGIKNEGDQQRHDFLYQEKEGGFFVDVNRSRDGKYIVLTSISKTTSECHVYSADDAKRPPYILHPRRNGERVFVDHVSSGHWVAASTTGTSNYEVLVAADGADGRPLEWKNLIPSQPDVAIDDVFVFDKNVVVLEQRQGLPRLHVYAIDGSRDWNVSLPEDVYHISTGDPAHMKGNVFHFSVSGPLSPSRAGSLDLSTGNVTLFPSSVDDRGRKSTGFPLTAYVIERKEAVSQDGTMIPYTTIRPRQQSAEPSCRPVALIVYGAYGVSASLDFDPYVLVLLEQGFCVCFAHVRGGGEYGTRWAQAARDRYKRRTFEDVHAVGSRLLAEGDTTPSQMVLVGGSAGGLTSLISAAQSGGVFRNVVARVPFCAPLDAMVDSQDFLAVHERTEWGDPLVSAEIADTIRSYDPVSNADQFTDKNVFIALSENDARVHWHMPAMLAQRIELFQHEGRLRGDKVGTLEVKVGSFGHLQQEAPEELSFMINAVRGEA